MCLSVVAKIVALLGDGEAQVDLNGVRKDIELGLIADAQIGDYVLIHTGYAISKVDSVQAKQMIDAMNLVESVKDY